MNIGDRVRLKKDRTGIIWNDDGTGTGKRLCYTVHQARKGEEGKVVSPIFCVLMDNGIEIGYTANDFIEPEEEFVESFELVSPRRDQQDLGK